jgi:hypothetical protein
MTTNIFAGFEALTPALSRKRERELEITVLIKHITHSV